MFFPLPVGALDLMMQSEKDFSQMKKVKKVAYLSYPLFCRVLQGETLTAADLTPTLSCWPPVSDEKANGKSRPKLVSYTTEIEACFFKTSQRPRLEIDRLYDGALEGQFFYCTDQHFTPKSGLFFLAEFDDIHTLSHFEASLRLLADSGLGADRSVGRGTFTFRKSMIDLPSISEPDLFCLLSLFHPTRGEVACGLLRDKSAAYNVIRRSGQCGAFGVDRYRRADLWMLAEGSVLPVRPTGHIPCVLPQTGPIPHNVYRYGVAMALPMVGKAEVS
jgi:CRISPR-associated protein Csm4